MAGKTVLLLELLFMLKSVSMNECSDEQKIGDCGGKEDCTMILCGKHAICKNTVGILSCECEDGYKERNNLTDFTELNGRCIEVNECWENTQVNICSPNASCSNTIGSYACTCRSVYAKLDPSSHVSLCTDVNECRENRNICTNAYCNNTIGSYTCTCHSGYAKLDPSSGMCTDIDECESGENLNGGICGTSGNCTNTNGSFWCQCPPGHTNYGNERTPCSELKCDQFMGTSAALSQAHMGLAGILSLMKESCLVLSQPGREDPHTPTVLLNSLFAMTEDILSDAGAGGGAGGVAMSHLLSLVEDSIRLIGPQLSDGQTSMNTSQTEAKIVVSKNRTPPSGPVHLRNTDASLETDWSTAIGNGTYPGFAFAALVSYKNLEVRLNHSFEHIAAPQENGTRPSYQIFSKVVSVVVSNPDTRHLERPVLITLRHLQELEGPTEVNFTCAYWKAAEGGPQLEEGGAWEGGGAWSTTGCTQVTSDASHTVCSCEHLSSFAVLMALYPVNHTFGLMLLTKVGLVVSLLCLALCILTFAFCRSIKGTRSTIHLHLCLCLFWADLVFLAGISQTQPQGGCRLVAGLLHLFFLGAFSWMLLEGVQLYRMVVVVFDASIRPLYLYAVGYGVPLAIVLISAVSRPMGYGTDQYCWLSREEGLIWSFFGPVCVVIGLNAFFFSVTLWKLAQKFSSLNPDLTHLHKIRAFTVTAIAQLCVLGLMWLSGVFLFSEGALVAAYIFTILNSLQGALIFLLNCLLSKQVREEYAKLLSCICPQPMQKYSDVSSSKRSSQLQASQGGQHTDESTI